TNLTGSYNLPNVLAAVAVGTYFNIDIDTIKTAIEEYVPSNSRSQWINTKRNQLILDAYNANPSSMEAALSNFSVIAHDHKILLLGAMKEVGKYSLEEHEQLIKKCIALNFKQVYLVGAEFASFEHYGYPIFETSTELYQHLTQLAISNALILIKGSRGSKM